MPGRPDVLPVADELYDELGVTQPLDETYDWQFLVFLHGLATALGRVPGIVRDTATGPGWSGLMDPTTCPDWALPWLAQFVGVQVRVGDDTTTTRSRITTHAGFNRGTPAAMRAAAQATLTGSKHVGIIEADSSAYHLSVVTLTDETPDTAATEAAVRSQKPAGLILVYTTVDGMAWDEATTTWATAPDVAWDDVSTDNPV